MKLFFDFLPIVLFFVAYKLGGGDYTFNGVTYHLEGIYVATAVMIVVSVLQVSITWLLYRKVERAHLITLALVLVLGGLTLWLHNPDFIKWKPTAVNWLFAIVFIGAYMFTDKSLLERMMADHIQLPAKIWARLNLAWVAFFVLSGLVNLYVAFNFDEATWVNFKLFGMLGLTVVFVIAQSIYLAKHAVEVKKEE
ncbi:septation protein A [Methylophaga sulfidovorans]|uniref:Inner membrane-spanning protein YciB n=1 Tax=Methylophaga sulfidovorans TaxID=45496 RepID=A0A1I3WWU9_9GAMM|nr:septation protein A [Methylophaga sulfidovorans]SFK11955.1 intracellular septation protein [Methylophaga sulfidovorans]